MVAKPSSPEPITVVPIEEAEELRAKVAELQKKNEEWESKYLRAEGEVARLKRDQEHKKEALQESRKRVRESKEKIEKIGDSKLSADDNLIAKNEEINRLNCSYEEVKKIGKMALEAQKKWRLKHQEQVQETQKVDKQLQLEGIRNQELERLHLQEKMRRERLQANIEDVIAQKTREVKKQLHLEGTQRQEFESLYLREKMMRECLQADIEGVLDLHVRTYEDQIAQLREELRDVNANLAQRERVLELVWDDSDRWRDDFARLAAFSNIAIEELPEMLARAEVAMPYYKIPKEIMEFTQYCKKIIEYYKMELAKAKKGFV
ncbi:hypothetical protein QL285_026539 [Trifolium repens]|nr:hypothetical protein QL285_026539 [Trifolium repens]